MKKSLMLIAIMILIASCTQIDPGTLGNTSISKTGFISSETEFLQGCVRDRHFTQMLNGTSKKTLTGYGLLDENRLLELHVSPVKRKWTLFLRDKKSGQECILSFGRPWKSTMSSYQPMPFGKDAHITCSPYIILGAWLTGLNQKPVGMGIGSDESLLELRVSRKGTWSLLRIDQGKCSVIVGTNWVYILPKSI
jgi:hypothetical protein